MQISRRTALKSAVPLLGGATSLAALAADAAEKPRYGGHLRIGYTLEPTGLDPHTGKSGGDLYYWRGMFDQLVDFDLAGKPDPSVSLASAWETSESPPSITFTLRQGVQFHDGTPFNAEAVKKNIERVQDPATKSIARTNLSAIKSVEVLGEHKLRFNLAGPWGAGLGLLPGAGGAMNSPAAIAKLGLDYAWAPVGTGPFKLKEVVTGSHVRYVRNENYWRKDKAGNRLPYLDEVTIRIIKDETVLAAALRANEIDLAYVPYKEVDSFLADKNFTMTKLEGAATNALLVMNPDLAPMNDINLRRAVCHAINPADINKAAAFGRAVVADAGLWPVNHAYHKRSSFRADYDLAKAKAALVAGGKPNGFELPAVTWNNPILTKTAEIIRAQLGRVGIKLNIETLTVGTATDRAFASRSTPMYLTSWSMSVEPDINASASFKSGGFYNPSKQLNSGLDQLIVDAAAAYDIDKRKALYHRINDTVLAQGLWHPMLYAVVYAAANHKVRNARTFIHADGRHNFKELWLRAA